ncbi:MAG: UDP-3-O-(3-hydroxymyristoyl)glucosamine N-acyltransferase [Campylobacterota bacterium]|nr:UDP-3-O-(3-hydroxymyristoyl)glucosamine N-acyltransferase [Campylobacterota bacterium]
MKKLKDICSQLGIRCESNIEIEGLNTLKDANSTHISFLENKKYRSDLEATNAAAVFVTDELKELVPKGTIALITPFPYISLAKASKFFAPDLIETDGKEAAAGENCNIMENVYIGKNTLIGNNCTIMSGAFIGDNVHIGNNTIIYPNVTIYRDCTIGSDTIIHANTSIGCDGFGFATTKEGLHIKIYQNGNVVIGNNVEIGSNCAIDRAAFNSTVIEDMARLDNLVHIAHNCIIGRGCILTGQVGIAGSTILKEYVVMAGQSGAAGHIEIAPFTTISARGVVSKSIKTPKKQWAGFPLMEHRTWLKLQGKINKLLKG